MKRLRELRISHKKSQDQISKLLHISQAAYSKYETGAAEPDNDALLFLADFYNVSVDYLLGREESLQKEMPAGFPSDISQFENDLRKVNFPVDKWTQLSDEQQRILLSTIENFIKNNK